MKKLSLYTLIGLLFCNFGLANSIFLECKFLSSNNSVWGESPPSDIDSFQYYLLTADKKTLYVKGNREKTKGECALGNCETISKYDDYPKLLLKEESSEYLFFGRDWYDGRNLFDDHTINKTNLKLVVFNNLVSIAPGMYDNKDEIVEESQRFYQCKKINKFPF